jgi:2-isopropylmalate synthase
VRIALYDATLTEGAREPGAGLSVRDKLRVALRLAELGVAYVEAGWPGERADGPLFREAARLDLGGAKLAACAALTLRGRAADERELAAALRTGAGAVTLSVPVGHGGATARAAGRVGAAVAAVRRAGRDALVEVSGYFDAPGPGAPAALALCEAAARAGATALLLADATGGALPPTVEAGVAAARRVAGRTAVGVRARDDAGVAVANTLAAAAKGATLLAVTVNGYGERCGAADLAAVAAGLELKLGHQALAPGGLRHLTSLAHFVAELCDRETPRGQPYVGRDAFTTAGGTPTHVDPGAVGNRLESAMADERGHPGALRLARALGLPGTAGGEAKRVVQRLAAWERRGFRFEGAEASFELVLRQLAGKRRSYFEVLGYRVLDLRRHGQSFTEATVEVRVAGETVHAAAVGVGPVNALDQALRRALGAHYPELADMQLVQSRSHNLTTGDGTAGTVRFAIDSADGRDRWGTAGVSDNLLDACCQSLVDAIEYKLTKDDVAPRRSVRAARARRAAR